VVVNAKKRTAAGGLITVKNDGVTLASGVSVINIVGDDEVEAVVTAAGEVSVFHPAPSFQPYWPEGVTDPVERTTVRISSPSGGEGSPFKTGGWAETNQYAGRTTSFSLTSPGNRTGFGGDSTFEIKVYDADGASTLETYTTPAITGDGTHNSPSGNITVAITNYGADATKWQAKPSVTIRIDDIFTDAGLDGGRYHVEAIHHTDTTTDGGQTKTFTQSDVFLDTNPTTPSIGGPTGIAETIGQVQTKHLSGLEYYILGSVFTATVSGIDQLNRNTIRTSGNLYIRGPEFGLPNLSHCPFGTGSGYFSGWDHNHDRDDVLWQYSSWAITSSNYRYIGPTANIYAQGRDPWATGSTSYSNNNLVLIDTYATSSTATYEPFNDEARREFIDGVGASATSKSFGDAGSYDSEKHLSISGTTQAIVFNSYLMVPDQTTYIRSDGSNTPNADWTSFKPTLGGTNPDYSSLGVGSGVEYARRFTKTAGINIPSFSLVFSGSWANGNALADLQNGALEIYVYRIAVPGGTPGVYGAPPGNDRPLRVHLPFNFADYNDGLTEAGSGIREGTSSGNTINCTFGTGTPADTGFYAHVRILDDNTKINSVSVTFF
jgi:hypothetical protein